MPTTPAPFPSAFTMDEADKPDTWANTTIAIIGGDERDAEIARLARLQGARVHVHAVPWTRRGKVPGVIEFSTAAPALEGADIALLPMSGIATDGALFAPAVTGRIIPTHTMLAGMRSPASILLGAADQNLRTIAQSLHIGLHEFETRTDLTLLRGPAIVEGLLQVIIENTDVTIHKSMVTVVGLGTIGLLLVRTLVALGATVRAVARNPTQRAAAYAAGAAPHPLEALPQLASSTDILLSTPPQRVVTRTLLSRLPSSALVVDVAAPPGGVDFDAARELGLTAVWARGMGRRAPVTVGANQWVAYQSVIEEILRARQPPSAG